jgi:hypothetical protein
MMRKKKSIKELQYNKCMNITITDIIGKKVMHGSPGLMVEEIISKVVFLKDVVEIEFESQAYTQMEPEEFEYMLRYEELNYDEKTHWGMSSIIFCEG